MTVDCDCLACRPIPGIASGNPELCYRETPEAIATIARRAEMRRIVSRWVWVRPIDRLPDKSRRAVSLAMVLKDCYGPSYEPYERDCLFRELSHYEQRRERVSGRVARTRHEIAESLGYRRKRDRFYELAYRDNPFFALVKKDGVHA